ncbi:MAG: pyridine nucleotide-disulfide oxidoreductase [Desulfobulbus sp.]|nr:MAG: pyridine nucleotide-disulfide oxidoreductase [Desulfobulbus sp.]
MAKNLLLAGGGHAHMMVLANLGKFKEMGHLVTVIQPSPHHYYSGMGPGMLGLTYRPEEIRFATRRVVEKQGGTFILGKVAKVEPAANRVILESGETIAYDVVSFNIGSNVSGHVAAEKSDTIFPVKPIERLHEAQQLILRLGKTRPLTVGVVGGGPSAVEIAGNVWGLARKADLLPITIRIFARTSIMTSFPDGVRYHAINSLNRRKIEIIEHCAVTRVEPGKIEIDSRQSYGLDVIFIAVGVRPSAVFRNSGMAVGPEGGLLVNRYLQSVEHPNIFGGGDCIYFQDKPLDKVGVYAVRENPVLLHNLQAALEGRPLRSFDPGGDYLLIFNLGDGTGIFRKKWLLFDGRPAFLLKDYIDRRFMNRFQALE